MGIIRIPRAWSVATGTLVWSDDCADAGNPKGWASDDAYYSASFESGRMHIAAEDSTPGDSSCWSPDEIAALTIGGNYRVDISHDGAGNTGARILIGADYGCTGATGQALSNDTAAESFTFTNIQGKYLSIWLAYQNDQYEMYIMDIKIYEV